MKEITPLFKHIMSTFCLLFVYFSNTSNRGISTTNYNKYFWIPQTYLQLSVSTIGDQASSLAVKSPAYEGLTEKVKKLEEEKKVLEKLVKQYKNRKTNEVEA